MEMGPLELMRRVWRQRRATARNVVSYLYAVVLLIVLAGTVVAAVGFAVGIVVGGSLGPQLAAWAGAIIRMCMVGGSVAVIAGMSYVYLSGRHTLTLNDADIVDSASSKRGDRVAGEIVSGKD